MPGLVVLGLVDHLIPDAVAAKINLLNHLIVILKIRRACRVEFGIVLYDRLLGIPVGIIRSPFDRVSVVGCAVEHYVFRATIRRVERIRRIGAAVGVAKVARNGAPLLNLLLLDG